MRKIEITSQFKRDYKRESRTYPDLDDASLRPVLDMLASDAPLPARLRDHALKGNWAGCRDCHLRPDLVLIYRKTENRTLTLVRLGSHSELFS